MFVVEQDPPKHYATGVSSPASRVQAVMAHRGYSGVPADLFYDSMLRSPHHDFQLHTVFPNCFGNANMSQWKEEDTDSRRYSFLLSTGTQCDLGFTCATVPSFLLLDTALFLV